MKIIQFNKATCLLLGDEIESALKEVAEKYGLTVRNTGGVMGDLEFIAKMKFVIKDPTINEAAARKKYNELCDLYDLKPENFHAVFSYSGQNYRFVGFTSSAKYPLSAQNISTGKNMKFTHAIIKSIKEGTMQ